MILMDKEKIIKTFLDKGCQIDPESLSFFSENPEKLDIFFERTKNLALPAAINLSFVEPMVEQEVEVLNEFEERTSGNTLTVEGLTKFFAGRYEHLKKNLAGRLELVNLISINKITPKTKKFSLIVMVKEKDGSSLLVEDFTGETNVCVQDSAINQVVTDEVIGTVCEKENETINTKKIIFPEIPLKREIAKTERDAYALFLSDMFLDQKNNSKKIIERIKSINCEKLYVFILGNVSSREEDIRNFFDCLPENTYKIFLKGETDPNVKMESNSFSSSAALIKIENKILVLICNGKMFSNYKKIWEDQPSEGVMLNLLKKRHMNPIFDFNKKISVEDTYIIDMVPDIFVSSNFDKPGTTNYKGTTIISNGSFLTEPIYWLINLKTRETIKMDFT